VRLISEIIAKKKKKRESIGFNKDRINKPAYTIDISEYGHEVSRAD
jgi:hypothetical protein